MAMPGAYRVRELVIESSGRARYEERGDYVEILSGGKSGRSNILYCGRRDWGPAATVENAIPCVPGRCVTADFDYLDVIGTAGETIKFRVRDDRRAVAVDSPITGKPRFKWLARSSGAQIVASNVQTTLLDLTADPEQPWMDGEEDFYPGVYWAGWVVGDRPFTIVATAKTDPTQAGAFEWVISSFAVKDYFTVPFGATWAAGYACDFTENNRSGSGSTVLISRFPVGCQRVLLIQGSGFDMNYEYLIGVRGG